MANDYFQFKEFTIHQARSAMRVTTDACVLGAWVAKHFSNHNNILDIGSGTGLLLLMMAQQMSGQLTGVELDEEACHESLSNISGSLWKDRITVKKDDITAFNPGSSFDLIVSNPPFYEGDLQRPDPAQNMAMHGTGLTLQALAVAVERLLDETGHAIIMLPPHRMEIFTDQMEHAGLFEQKSLALKHSRNHKILRTIRVFSRSISHEPTEEALIIREPDGSYTTAFSELMKPYYLYI